jgi:guanylate kinase
LVEYSHQNNYLGTTLEIIERIHNMSRICVMTVKESGFKILHSKQFPAIYIRYYMTPLKETTSTLAVEEGEEKKPTREEEKETGKTPTEAKDEIDPDLFDCTIHSTDPSAIEQLHSGFVGWFPELAHES